MTPSELIISLNAAFTTQFPKGFIYTNLHTSGILNDYISVSIGLVNDKSLLPSNLRENDPMGHKFLISIKDNSYTAELCHGSLKIKPIDAFYAMSSVKTGFRKTSGDSVKINKMFVRWFAKLKTTVQTEKLNIYRAEQYQDYI
jgi:hypothetical protein